MHLTGADQAKAIGGTIISGALAFVVSTFTSLFVPSMRIFDGITDPILGGLIDKTKSRFGKFRPFMVIGNLLLALSVILMMIISRAKIYINCNDDLEALKILIFTIRGMKKLYFSVHRNNLDIHWKIKCDEKHN